METHTYRRRHLSVNRVDAYNATIGSEGVNEFWTNGWTTHLMLPPTKGEEMATSPESRLARVAPAAVEDRNVVRNSILAGSVSGMASTVMLYPMDVLRTKLQSEGVVGSVHRGPLQMLRHTLQHGGIRALYTGLSLPLGAQAVYKATVFSVNNKAQQVLNDIRTMENHKTGILEPGRLTYGDRFLCGFLAGGVNAFFFVTPVEFIRNQLIAQHSRKAEGQQLKSTLTEWEIVRRTLKHHGLPSLWRGATISVTRDALGCGCFFWTMAQTQHMLTPPGEAPSVLATMISGGLSGLAFWVAALPLDTVKTWIQSSDIDAHVSARESILRVYQEGGYRGLFEQTFRGWQVAYTRGIPSAAITISVYSTAYRFFSGSEGHM